MTNFAEMNKAQLRAACKEVGISYSKLTVSGMRDTLTTHAAEMLRNAPLEEAPARRALPLQTSEGEIGRWTQTDNGPVWVAVDPATIGRFGMGHDEDSAVCPHCGINHCDNGVSHFDDESVNRTDGRSLYCLGLQNNEWSCMACNGEWGEVRTPFVKPAAPVATGTGLKIEKGRDEQNGVKRPSVGGKCRAVWDALDAYQAEMEEMPTAKVVKAIAADEGWNPNNASIEFYNWRKFNGITGRSK